MTTPQSAEVARLGTQYLFTASRNGPDGFTTASEPVVGERAIYTEDNAGDVDDETRVVVQ